MIYFEDIEAGSAFPMAARFVSADEIIRFGKAYDPHFFHLDAERAKDSLFGGLVASGWHMCALSMAMMADMIATHQIASMGSPGIDRCDWQAPLHADTTIRGRYEILSTRPSASKPFGLLKTRTSLLSEADAVLMTMIGNVIVGLRP